MATIPSKQLHRVGTTEQLELYLDNREIGYSTSDHKGYIKLDDTLIPIGSEPGIVDPSSNSVLVGKPDGTYYWDGQGITLAPYDEHTDLWVSLCGIGLYATASRLDSEGHFVSADEFRPTGSLPIYGSLLITDSTSGAYYVSIRKGSTNPSVSSSYVPIGALLPIDSDIIAENKGMFLGIGSDSKVGWKKPVTISNLGSVLETEETWRLTATATNPRYTFSRKIPAGTTIVWTVMSNGILHNTTGVNISYSIAVRTNGTDYYLTRYRSFEDGGSIKDTVSWSNTTGTPAELTIMFDSVLKAQTISLWLSGIVMV